MTARSPIEQMVDRACGISPAEIERMKKEAAELADAQTAALLALEKSAQVLVPAAPEFSNLEA